jgi:hypothetical protein
MTLHRSMCLRVRTASSAPQLDSNTEAGEQRDAMDSRASWRGRDRPVAASH